MKISNVLKIGALSIFSLMISNGTIAQTIQEALPDLIEGESPRGRVQPKVLEMMDSKKAEIDISNTLVPAAPMTCFEIIRGVKGKETLISSINPNNNYGSHPDFRASSWTYGGAPGNIRTLIEYDFNFLPTNAIVHSATLILKGYSSTSNGSHHGSNKGILKKITSSWTEYGTTWNTAPSSTSVGAITTPVRTGTQDVSIDVTSFTQDAVSNPGSNFGWMFQLETEVHYRRAMFASGDNVDPNLHPVLEICFTIPPAPPAKLDGSQDISNEVITLSPNPTSDYVQVNGSSLNKEKPTYIDIISIDGKQIRTNELLEESDRIQLNDLVNGIYVITLRNNGNIYTNRIVKE